LLQRNPSDAWALASRGRILLLQKNYKAAKETLLRVTPAVPDAQLANTLAWMLATCPDDSVRDGVAAIKWASKACKLTNWTEAGIIDTYAAACAEIGDFESAVKWAEESIQRAKGDKKVFQEHLAAFQQKKPWRE
jgi:TPR repeat protein